MSIHRILAKKAVSNLDKRFLVLTDTGILGTRSSYLPYQVDVRPSQEFNHTNARNKLAALEISSKHEDRIRFLVPHNGLVDTEQMDSENLDFTLQEGRFLHMSGSVDTANTVTIGCAGAVLVHLQRRRATMSDSNHQSSEIFQIRSIEMFSLTGTMLVLFTVGLSSIINNNAKGSSMQEHS